MYANSNTKGLVSKIALIKKVLSDTDSTIACLTETHLSQNKGIVIDGYSFFEKAREGKSGGGVGIFVKNMMKQNISPTL